MPFSFEAIVICLCALGTDIWCGLMLRSNNVFASLLALLFAMTCAATALSYLVRWFALP